MCCLSRVSTKNVELPRCVCVCVSRQERRRQTRNPFLFLLVKTFHPSIHPSGRSKRGLLLRVKTFGLSSCCVPCLMTLSTSLVSPRVFLMCFVYRNHHSISPPPPPEYETNPIERRKTKKNNNNKRLAGVGYVFRACVSSKPKREYKKLHGNNKTHTKL